MLLLHSVLNMSTFVGTGRLSTPGVRGLDWVAKQESGLTTIVVCTPVLDRHSQLGLG